MNVSLAELFWAFRHAKHALYQEQHGFGRASHSRTERRLQATLESVQRRLRKAPGWFDEIPPGSFWVVPKGTVAEEPGANRVVRIGGERSAPAKELRVRVHATPSAEFALVETLWLWRFGPGLELLLGPAARGNRLNVREGQVDQAARGPFEYWWPKYRGFREGAFATARNLLKQNHSRCFIATFDFANYYDEIDPSFLLGTVFVADVTARAASAGLAFDKAEYAVATASLLRAMAAYRGECRRLTGVLPKRGIPIGWLTSRLIANLVLSPLDDLIQQNSQVRYYARYVDDVLIVADVNSRTPGTSRGVAERFLPLKTGTRGKELLVDADKLGRRGCVLKLQTQKVKGYLLRGKAGLNFLKTIQRDVRLIASERRAFLEPDGLGTDSPVAALFVGSDHHTPVQVLRDADKLKVERYAASVTIGRVRVGVEMLRADQREEWCREQLGTLVDTMTDPDHWLGFLDYSLRALAVCLRASDIATSRLVFRRFARHVGELSRNSTELRWNGRKVARRKAVRSLAEWLSTRIVEELCGAIPVEHLSTPARVRSYLHSVLPTQLRTRRQVVTPVTVRRLAVELIRTDWRAVDRESDLMETWPSRADLGLLDGGFTKAMAAKDAGLLRSIAAAKRFIKAAATKHDSVYSHCSPTGMLLMTRAPSAFDIARRWNAQRDDPASLIPVVNALRGTRYPTDLIRRVNRDTIDIAPPRALLFGSGLRPLTVVLGNLTTREAWIDSAADGQPHLSKRRIESFAKIINEAIRCRKTVNGDVLLVLPELSVPRQWIRGLATALLKQNIGVIGGLEYEREGRTVINEAFGAFSIGRHASIVCQWPKSRPARIEGHLLKSKKPKTLRFRTHTRNGKLVVRTSSGAVGTLICSELLDVREREKLLGRIDLLIVPAWNTDTATFEHTIQTVANDLHCFVAVANDSHASDSRVHAPRLQRHLRDCCRIIRRHSDETISTEVEVQELRNFQKNVQNGTAPASPPKPAKGGDSFKPLPPGYPFNRK